MRYFFIQGFYYQRQVWFENAYMGDEGLSTIVRDGLIPSMYAGSIFHRDHNEQNELVGAMQDENGPSELRDIVLTETELSFSKYYQKREFLPPLDPRDDFIRYVFKKGEGNTWIGEFSFPNHPDGALRRISRCVLTPVDWNLFKRDISKFVDDAVGQVGIDFDELARVESEL